MNNLYTFVLDYKGGTYISQVTDNLPEDAVKKWIDKLDPEQIGIKTASKVISDPDENISPLDTLKNVWCMTFMIDDELALVNIVKTSAD
ncbi:MAG: hypothetical protein GY795_33410 [Desulfobacterales bacterium]|nr:hypothetical protein [Desulfobacterales bacterium]